MNAGKLAGIVLTIVVCCIRVAYADTFPACETNATDIDGDGYGWENEDTCIIDTISTGPSSFTNLETGLTVPLIRAYWNIEDFDKDVVCARHFFDGTEYERIDASITGYGFNSRSLTPPFLVPVTHSFNSESVMFPWSVARGVYSGPSDLGRTPWMEIISTTVGQSAVRIWFLDQTFTECSAINPNDFFEPTGSPPITNECVDSDGDGWGWNGVEACVLDPRLTW